MNTAVLQIISCDMLAVLTVISVLAVFVVSAVLSVPGPELLLAAIFSFYYCNFYNNKFIIFLCIGVQNIISLP